MAHADSPVHRCAMIGGILDGSIKEIEDDRNWYFHPSVFTSVGVTRVQKYMRSGPAKFRHVGWETPAETRERRAAMKDKGRG